MEVKAVKPISFLFFRTETKISELTRFLPVGQELIKEAVKYNLTINGPVHWHYFGFEGDVNRPFTLEIALPVGEVLEEYDGKFHFKRTDPFKCVSATHEGNWLDMPKSYDKLMQFITENNLKPLSSNREIYVNADFRHPEANVTEIQIGIN
jgi:effector-binding domain-containing protein